MDCFFFFFLDFFSSLSAVTAPCSLFFGSITEQHLSSTVRAMSGIRRISFLIGVSHRLFSSSNLALRRIKSHWRLFTKISATLCRLEPMARSRQLSPVEVRLSIWAPCFRSSFTTSECPFRAARCNGVCWFLSTGSIGLWLSISVLALLNRPPSAAQWIGNQEIMLRACKSQLFSSKSLMIEEWPSAAAMWRARRINDAYREKHFERTVVKFDILLSVFREKVCLPVFDPSSRSSRMFNLSRAVL